LALGFAARRRPVNGRQNGIVRKRQCAGAGMLYECL